MKNKNKNNNKNPKISNAEKLSKIEDIQLNTCSTYDCTGLIPTAVKTDSEAKAYEELYPYITTSIENNEK